MNRGNRIAVLHASLNGCGGAEKLALTLVEGLRESGYNVNLITIEATKWSRVEHVLGFRKDLVNEELVMPPFKLMPTVYAEFLNWLSLGVIASGALRRKYDLTILTSSLPLPTFVDIQYLHFPDFLPELLRIYFPKYSKPFFYAYLKPYEAIINMLKASAKKLRHKPLLLTNSNFSELVIRRYLGLDSVVIYPPVDVEKYMPLSKNLKDRENIVLTVSRIEEGKNLESVIDAAKLVKNAKFVIVGSARQVHYLKMLKDKLKKEMLDNRVVILPNATEKAKLQLMGKAKIYLHPTWYEHFGIAVVEAMASGLVPVVHMSGGPWMDILQEKRGVHGYAYKSIDEAAAIIAELLENDALRADITERTIVRAKSFNARLFKKRMMPIIEKFSHT